MERLGEILAYEVSKHLEYRKIDVPTPLGISKASVIDKSPYLITIMRAGVPFFQGFLNYFDKSECGFIGAYRSDFDDKDQFDIDMGYLATGDVSNKEIIIIDPMLATGKSIVKAVNRILKKGTPKKIHIVAIIASTQGYRYVRDRVNFSTDFWIADMDDELNNKSYIVPGLGDAGDLSFGKKS
jgi:uracil phosphoribosyltransferase